MNYRYWLTVKYIQYKYFLWNFTITKILTLHLKYFQWSVTISEILVLYLKYWKLNGGIFIKVTMTEYKHIKEWAIFCVNIANIDQDLDNTRVKSTNNKINNIYSLFLWLVINKKINTFCLFSENQTFSRLSANKLRNHDRISTYTFL